MSKVRGAGMNMVPEFDVRALLITGLAVLAGDAERIGEIVRRVDVLRQGSQDEWEKDLTKALRRVLDPREATFVRVLIGYPDDAAHLPCISVTYESGSEDQAGAVHGDVLRRRSEVIGSGDSLRVQRVTELGIDRTSVVQIGCWSPAPELSLLLQAAVTNVLLVHKGQLSAAGVHDVSLADGGAPTDQQTQIDLRVAYVPLVVVTLGWTYRTTRRKLVPNSATLLAPTFET